MAVTIRILGDNRQFIRSMDRIDRRMGAVDKRFMGVNRTADRFGQSARRNLFRAAAFSAPLILSTKLAADFGKAMAEVSTLGGTPAQMEKLTKQTLELAKAFGANEIVTAKAVYQAISSGAVDATNANELLTIAGKLSVGGVTTLDTAVDGLTTALSAFGPELLILQTK